LRIRALGAAVLCAIATVQAAPAQMPGAPPPQQRAIERVAPPPAPPLAPPLTVPESTPASGPGQAMMVRVAGLEILGNTALATVALRATLAGLEGATVPLAAIETARFALLRAYRDAGYPYVSVTATLSARADGAMLRFAVTEGFVAEIRLDGDIGPAGTQVLRFLERLRGQRPLTAAALERALLLASDIPGVAVRGVLRPLPGEAGAMQLVAQLVRRPFGGFVNLDNRGYQLTGTHQALVVAGLNAFSSFGERSEVALLGTEGGRQSFAQLSEELFLGGSGLRLRAQIGAGRAAPGAPLSAIGYAGDTRMAALGLSFPVIRARSRNLTVSAQAETFDSSVEADLGAGKQDLSQDSVRALRIGVEASARDALLGFAPMTASSSAALRLGQGIEAFGATDRADGQPGAAARAGSDFGFTKLTGEIGRTQPLFEPMPGWLIGAQGLIAGQWSGDVLPLSEKFYLGGTRLGRGFYSGQISGDTALAAALELQLSTGFTFDPGAGFGERRLATQVYLFRDEGRTWENQAADPDRRLASWGGGVRFVFDDRLQFDIEAVRRITRQPEGSGAGIRPADATDVFGRLMLRF
jgi:hemolysin activation/secretion protein